MKIILEANCICYPTRHNSYGNSGHLILSKKTAKRIVTKLEETETQDGEPMFVSLAIYEDIRHARVACTYLHPDAAPIQPAP